VSKTFRLLILLILLCLCLASSASADSRYWSCSGPYGGRIRAMAISPEYASDQTLFAGTESGGLFRSTDAGFHWNGVSGLPDDLIISSLVVSPSYAQDDTLFLSSAQGDIYRSQDHGETWSPRSDELSDLSVSQLAISPAYDTDQTLIAATNLGFYYSSTAGKIWTAATPELNALSVAILPSSGGTFTAYGGTTAGLYVSTNSGQTWQSASGDLEDKTVIAVAVSPDYDNDDSVLVGTTSGAYLYQDGAITEPDPWLGAQAIYQVLFSPGYAIDQTFFLGAEDGVYVSSDGGPWVWDGQIQDTVYALISSPEPASPFALCAGTAARGVFFSPDESTTWSERNVGIANVPVIAVASSPYYTRDRTIYAGGASGVWRSKDDGLSWALTPLDYAGVNALYCVPTSGIDYATYAATDGGIFTSLDEGDSWQATVGSLDVLDVLDLALGPDDQLWAATAGGGVYYSPDDGDSWEGRSSGLTSLHVTSIELLEVEGVVPYLVAGTWGSGTFVSEDGGLNWDLSTSAPDTPYIHDLESAVDYAGQIVSFAGTTAGIFRSVDLGQAWDFVGKQGNNVLAVAIHPDYAVRYTCYVGTRYEGVMRSRNGGLTWPSLSDGLGSLCVHKISVASDGEEPVLFAATGGGIWRYGDAPHPPTNEVLMPLPLVFR